jgi:hypothetical protein
MKYVAAIRGSSRIFFEPLFILLVIVYLVVTLMRSEESASVLSLYFAVVSSIYLDLAPLPRPQAIIA